MQMRFDTVHEYYMRDACIHWCEDHETLLIASHGENTDRLMIEGLDNDAIDRLRLELNKLHLEETTNVTNKDLVT